MDIPKQAKVIVDEAEHRVRSLVAEAAAQGAYDDVSRLADLARSLHDLARIANGNGTLQDPTPAGGSTRASNEPVGRNRRRAVPTSQPSRGGKRRIKKGDYPKFYRRGDELVKIGWSKKGKSEYVHKAPRRVIDALAAAIARRTSSGRLFTVDDLLPLKDLNDGSELPAYQVYVALAWFKTGGLVKQNGRRGYSIRNGADLTKATGAAWECLHDSTV